MSSANSAKAVDAIPAAAGPAPQPPAKPSAATVAKARFPRVNGAIDRAIRVLSLVGLGFLKPIVAICRGEDPRAHMRQLWLDLGAPLVAIAAFRNRRQFFGQFPLVRQNFEHNP